MLLIKHPCLLNLPPLKQVETVRRSRDAMQQEVACYRLSGRATGDDAYALYFLQRVERLPVQWTGIVHDAESGDEWSFGSWYPIALRPCKDWSAARRRTIVHVFPGGQGTLGIRWGEEAFFTYIDGSQETFPFPFQDHEGATQLDETIATRLTRLIP